MDTTHLDDPNRSYAVMRPMTPVVAVRARSVSYAFGQGEARTQVLHDNHLDIGRGEIVILTGPSGSGKTTLLTLIGTLRQVQDGSLKVLGRELSGLPRAEQIGVRREIGFIFQHHNLFSSLSALENVRMATALRPAATAEMDRRASELLGELGLADRVHNRPARLSGGQRQRVAIARALVNRPALVLADEPTAALDAESGRIVMDLFHRLATGPDQTTILIVTHDQRLLERAHRIVNMVGGRIVSNVLADQTIRICKMLRQIPDLSSFDVTVLARVSDHMTIVNRSAGDVIVREGTPGDCWYVIATGQCEELEGGAARTRLRPGDHFGELTAITHDLVPRTVRARTDVELFVLSAPDLESLLTSDTGLESRVRLHLMSRQE